jgi:hypothetical protein
MTHRSAILAVVFLLAACGSTAAGSSTTAPAGAGAANCGPARARTLAASSVARVYSLGGMAYGCSLGAAKSYNLGQRRTCLGAPLVAPVTVTGDLAAYGLESCGVDTGFTQVIVRRLTDGKQLRSSPATTGLLGPESYQSVDSLVLKGDGAVAWIGIGYSIIASHRDIEVQKTDAHGQRRLDSGSAVKLGSLQLHHSTLIWKHGRATRSATLS